MNIRDFVKPNWEKDDSDESCFISLYDIVSILALFLITMPAFSDPMPPSQQVAALAQEATAKQPPEVSTLPVSLAKVSEANRIAGKGNANATINVTVRPDAAGNPIFYVDETQVPSLAGVREAFRARTPPSVLYRIDGSMPHHVAISLMLLANEFNSEPSFAYNIESESKGQAK